LWANDENKFGHKLMEKMGWEKGKGLGANQDGMVTHVKVRQKDNQKGVGFEGHDDTWLAHQDDFQAVLAALNVEHGSAGEGMTETEKKASLEAISRKSKRRVHYQKFVKGKDSSNYSADDLGCILGTKSEKVGAKAKAVEEEAKGVEEEDNGKFKQASGSYQDYFAAKMAALKAKGLFKEVPEWKEENTLGGQTLGLGAGNGRPVDREIQRESLLCPDYLKAARDQSMGEKTVEEQEGEVEVAQVIKKRKRQREGAPEEQEVVQAEAGQLAKKKKRQTEEESTETDIAEVSEGQEAVKKSKKKKKDKKESSPASESEKVVADGIEDSEPPVKKKKKNKKDNDLGQTTDASTEDLEKQKNENIAKESNDALEAETINKTKKKKKKSNRNTPEEVQEQEVPETKAECEEEKVKKKKSKKSKKEKSSDEEMEAVADSGCEEVSDVKVKKTKKSKKEKTKPDDESNVESHSKKDISVPTSAHESTETACQEIDSDENAKKKKKKSKKNKTPDDEEQVVPEVEDQVLLKNYREAPGVLKGSNILAIPGYGASK